MELGNPKQWKSRVQSGLLCLDHRLEHPGVAKVLADGLFHTLKDSTQLDSDRDSQDAANRLAHLDPIGRQELELLPVREGDDNVLVTLQLLVRRVYYIYMYIYMYIYIWYPETKIGSKTHHYSSMKNPESLVLWGEHIACSSWERYCKNANLSLRDRYPSSLQLERSFKQSASLTARLAGFTEYIVYNIYWIVLWWLHNTSCALHHPVVAPISSLLKMQPVDRPANLLFSPCTSRW